MREYQIATLYGLPFLDVVVSGPKRSRRLRLIFDTGAALTQVHTVTLVSLGYSFVGRAPDLSLRGVTGPAEDGYSLAATRLFVMGRRFENLPLAAFDFSQWVKEGIDGLLGFDVIQQFHVEMDGPGGNLKVF
jgi:hypothetical protein